MTQFPAFPPGNPFPESQQDSIGDGSPDFPSSAGTREAGKFRPSSTPKLTQVAVVNDDGTQIGTALVPSSEEVAFWVRAMYAGLILKGAAEDVTDGLVFESL
mgnify:CR=1 FL=1